MARCYPVSLKLTGKLCIVVGGGTVAERKVQSLLGCGADIRVISPEITPRMQQWAKKGIIEHRKGLFTPGELEGAFLVISATSQEDVNDSVSEECFRRNILVNVVDVPSKANFFVPATMRRGPLCITVSTDGKSPLMAKIIREDLESLFGPSFEPFLDYLGQIRKRIIAEVDDPKRRQKILSGLADRESLRLVREGYLEEAKERVKNAYYCGGD